MKTNVLGFFLFLTVVIGFNNAFAAKNCAEGKRCYCTYQKTVKTLFTSKDGSKMESTCYEYANQKPDENGWMQKNVKDIKITSFTGVSEQRVERMCLTSCLNLDGKKADEYLNKKSDAISMQALRAPPTEADPASRQSQTPKAVSGLSSSKNSGPCPAGQTCFCSPAQTKKDGSWKSNCGYKNPGFNLIDSFTGKTEKEAVQECGLKCLRTQPGQLRQKGDGTWN